MQISKQVPLFTTPHLAALKAFYTEHFAFRSTLDQENYLAMVSSDGAFELGFMPPSDGEPEFQPKGFILCFEVKSADAEHERLTKAGLKPTRPLQDNPWGDRSFVVEDPAGISVYIYHQIPTSSGG